MRYNEIVQNTGDGVAIPFGVNGVIEDNEIVGNDGLAILYVAISNWGVIHGLISLEIFGHLDPQMAKENSGALYRAEVAALSRRLKLA